MDATVDARGLVCPLPILRLAQVVRGLPVGAGVLLLATDPAVRPDLEAWCAATGHALESLAASGGEVRARVRKR